MKTIISHIDDSGNDPRLTGDMGDYLNVSQVVAIARNAGHHSNLHITNYDSDQGEALIKQVVDEDIAVVGFSVQAFNVEHVLDLAERIKREKKEIHVVAGGPQFDPIFSKIYLQRFPSIDSIVVGQAEVTFPRLLNKLSSRESFDGLKGVAYRGHSGLVFNGKRAPLSSKELDAVPFPALDLVTQIPDAIRQSKVIPIRTSTGCNGVCSFCYQQEGKWRPNSRGHVLELVKRYSDLGFRQFLFVDNNFVGKGVERARDIAERLKYHREKTGQEVTWQFDARVDSFGVYNDERGFRHDIIEEMIDSGLSDIFVGVDAGNSEDLDYYVKRVSKHWDMLDQNRFYLEEIRNYYDRITVTPGFISFNERSTIKSIGDNIDFIYEFFPPQASPEIYWYRLAFYVGAPLTRRAMAKMTDMELSGVVEQLLTGYYQPEINDPLTSNLHDVLMRTKGSIRKIYKEAVGLFHQGNSIGSMGAKELHEVNYFGISSIHNAVLSGASEDKIFKLQTRYAKSLHGATQRAREKLR